MGVPARLLALLAVRRDAPARAVAAAPDRFVPADAASWWRAFASRSPMTNGCRCSDTWRTDRSAARHRCLGFRVHRARSIPARDPRISVALRRCFAPLALQTTRRASTSPAACRGTSTSPRLFRRRELLLDAVLSEQSHDVDARLLRASVRLVRGDFEGARADCAQLAATGGEMAVPGFACFAEGAWPAAANSSEDSRC